MDELEKLIEGLESSLEGQVSLSEEDEIKKLEEGIDNALVELEEAEKLEEANKIKFDNKTKLKIAITKKAVLMAKENGDALFVKYGKAKEVKDMAEAAIVKKYGMKAKEAVKEALASK